MSKYNFVINMNDEYKSPMSSPRPRFMNRGKFTKAYMPKSYTDFKAWLKRQLPELALDKELKVEIRFYFPMLKSWSKKKQDENVMSYKRTKPDIDNLIKTVLDACNNHVWIDDNQIVKIASSKQYDWNSRIEIDITEL